MHGHHDEFLEWSPEPARVPADRFNVSLVEGTERDEQGEVLSESWWLRRVVQPGESVAEVVQSVAHAIDGVLAVHVRADALAKGSYFWDRRPAPGA